MRIRALIVAALCIPLMHCASFEGDLTPENAHLGLAAVAGLYKLGCVTVGSSDFCSRQDQKLAKKAAKAASGAIDSLPPPQQ